MSKKLNERMQEDEGRDQSSMRNDVVHRVSMDLGDTAALLTTRREAVNDAITVEEEYAVVSAEILLRTPEGLQISQLSQQKPGKLVLAGSGEYILLARMSHRSGVRYDFGRGTRQAELRHGHILLRPCEGKSVMWLTCPHQTMVVRIPVNALRNAWACDAGADWSGLVTMDSFRQDSLIVQVLARVRAELTRVRRCNDDFVQCLLFQLYTDLVRRYAAGTSGDRTSSGMPPRRLNKVVSHIAATVGSDLSLSVLSNVAGVSRFYFCREFKKSMGMTPKRYVLEQRVEKAKLLLRTTPMPITEISEQLRFPTPSHFASTFRSIVGVTPTIFRRHT